MLSEEQNKIVKKSVDKIARAHLDALPILLQPLIKASKNIKGLTQQDAIKILSEWDKARTV